ncbi:hypothetical protein PILCRDRAFT_796614 [Piloderma croceum F 1598]|uniref:Uncharacterized protein n=1 Tax=Piloderma croceum (strain F 1598) TaxID=765440 RepID=A0A0C3FAZ4_PILCF|nr:hypothetical protein PILCRDRAFT_796614 [Piloderma croceum F 1598]
MSGVAKIVPNDSRLADDSRCHNARNVFVGGEPMEISRCLIDDARNNNTILPCEQKGIFAYLQAHHITSFANCDGPTHWQRLRSYSAENACEKFLRDNYTHYALAAAWRPKYQQWAQDSLATIVDGKERLRSYSVENACEKFLRDTSPYYTHYALAAAWRPKYQQWAQDSLATIVDGRIWILACLPQCTRVAKIDRWGKDLGAKLFLDRRYLCWQVYTSYMFRTCFEKDVVRDGDRGLGLVVRRKLEFMVATHKVQQAQVSKQQLEALAQSIPQLLQMLDREYSAGRLLKVKTPTPFADLIRQTDVMAFAIRPPDCVKAVHIRTS